ncbi:putative hydrolase [Neisseria meningitidis]|nr:putative hydrolase [Neisseria meningitidis]
MKNLAIFDLDNTLINTDSDHAWPQYLIKKGLVDAAETEAQNEKFYRDYQNGCLDIDAFLKFHLAPLARYSKEELAEFHREFMAEYIIPHISPMQRMLVQSHQMAGDETLVISSTNEFIITPSAAFSALPTSSAHNSNPVPTAATPAITSARPASKKVKSPA